MTEKPNLQALQNHAIQAALLSGNIIKQRMESRSWSVVNQKKKSDFVTSVDYESESTIVKYLQQHCPDISILTEESGSIGGETPYRWIIDPMDGTTNFLHGYPWVAVSIALEQRIESRVGADSDSSESRPSSLNISPPVSRGEHKGGRKIFPPTPVGGNQRGVSLRAKRINLKDCAAGCPHPAVFGEPIIGVVYNPFTQDLFTAIENHGAFHNHKPIHISNVQTLNDALLGTGYPFRNCEIIDEYLKIFRELFSCCHGIRRAGSAALDFAWLAAGAFDGFWEYGLSPWDMAAGAVLIREAGGIVTDFDGGDLWLESGNIIAGTPSIHPQILKVIQKIRTQ